MNFMKNMAHFNLSVLNNTRILARRDTIKKVWHSAEKYLSLFQTKRHFCDNTRFRD